MPTSDAELAVAAAEAGAEVLRSMYGSALEHFDKSPTDFATDADIAAERAIMAVLRAARPDDSVIGEELGVSGSSAAERCWLVDPLCGTLNFAAQTPLASANVALRSTNEIVAAASADPIAAEVFWTDAERAFRRHDETDTVLRPTSRSRLVDVNVDAPHLPAGQSAAADQFLAARLLTTTTFTDSFGPRVSSTTLALAWVAAGRRAGYVTDGQLRDSVHFSSGIAICQAAGCVVTNLRGEPLHSGREGMIAAADEPTHAALVAIVSALQSDEQPPVICKSATTD